MHGLASMRPDNGPWLWPGNAMDNSDITRELMAPLVFGLIAVCVAVFPLVRGVPSSPLVWLRMVVAGGYGIYLIVFALNTMSSLG